jgi:hypothetical protein
MRDNTRAHLARSLSHLSDDALLRRLARLVARDRATTAALLAHIAEVDSRRLYAPAGYPSMHAYCVGELRLSEDAAWKRIQAARAARRVPGLLDALVEGRLHLSAVCLLAPHITVENASELIEAATHRSKSEIEALLMRLFSRPEGLPLAPGQARRDEELAPGQVNRDKSGDAEHAPAHVVDQRVLAPTHSPERVSLHITISKSTHEKLRCAQALLSHAVPSGDHAQVLDRALDALISQLERRKFGAGRGRARDPRTVATPTRSHANARTRYIPAAVRRAVWERDQGRCTFVGTGGHRCDERRFLEFDHVEPVARGGRATVEGMRLRCRTHNQYEAERVFGAGFMSRKREEARRANDRNPADLRSRDIQTCLRRLGCRAEEARRAAAFSVNLHGAPLEEQLRAALQSLRR